MTSPNPTDAFVPTADNTRDLRDAFAQFATGVTIITTQTPEGPLAITANSFSSLSLDPALVLWCADQNSKRYPAFAQADHYAIHVLGADQADLCWQVARNGHALADMALDHNLEGVPVLAGCLARFECHRSAVHQGGDHAIIVGQILRASLARGGQPLTFFDGKLQDQPPTG